MGDLVEDDSSSTSREASVCARASGSAQEAEGEVDPVELERPLEVLGRRRSFRLVGVEPEQARIAIRIASRRIHW